MANELTNVPLSCIQCEKDLGLFFTGSQIEYEKTNLFCTKCYETRVKETYKIDPPTPVETNDVRCEGCGKELGEFTGTYWEFIKRRFYCSRCYDKYYVLISIAREITQFCIEKGVTIDGCGCCESPTLEMGSISLGNYKTENIYIRWPGEEKETK